MKGKSKRMMAGLLSVVMIAGTLSGCGGQEKKEKQEKSGSGDYQTTYGDKKFDDVTITVELFDRSNAPSGSTITDNKWVDYVNEEMGKVGIHVEFVPVPRNDEMTKMQTMVASQTAPDLTITYSYATAEDYYNQGGTWNLAPFIDGENQAKNLKNYLGTDVIDIARTEEDELYGIVARRATTAETNLFLRKDWLDKLGLGIPTTPDELYNVIEQMVKNNPDGKTNTIGAIAWMSYNLRLAFSKTAGDSIEAKIASGEDAFMDYYDEGMRDYYRYMNKMYNNGLMHKEYYTLDEDTVKSHIVTGDVGFFEANVNFSVDVMRGSLLKTLQENVPEADIISIPNLKNVNDGKQYAGAYAKGGLVAFCPLTAEEETVEACMTYLDWMCSEDGGFAIYHGFEGEHFEYDEAGTPVVKDAKYNAEDKDWIRADLFLTGNQGYFETVEEFNACTAKEAPGYEDYVIQNYENALTGTVINSETYTSPSTAGLITDINLVRDEYKISCVTCAPEEFDATYDEYMSELEEAGIKTIIEERTEHFSSLEK